MKYINLFKSFAVLASITLLLNACEKTAVTAPIGDGGSTYMKIVEAPESRLFFSPFSDVKTLDLFSIRKEPNSEKSLNTAAKAVLTSLPNLIEQFNTDNGTSFEELPDSLFTLKNASVVKTATGYDVNFAAGAFANEYTIDMDGSKWDVSHTYAVAFGLSASDGNILYPTLDTIMVFLSVKNKYDGTYSMTGTLTDVVNGGLTAWSPWECEFRTSGPNSVQLYDPNFDGIYHAISNGGNRSVYGAFGPEITFDPVTNAVVSITSIYAPAANTRDALLDNSQTYYWNAATKTLDVKFYMIQPSLVPAPPHIRTTFIDSYKYIGPR